jgi:transposase
MVMKHYPPEFKAEAVALYRSRPDATIKSVADDLGINSETLRNWIRLDDGRRTGTHTAAAPATAPPSSSPGTLPCTRKDRQDGWRQPTRAAGRP